MSADRPTAVIGMAVRLPGADTLDQFWDNNEAGAVFVRRFTPAELRAAGASESDLADPEYGGASALVDGIDQFDAGFFGMTRREAAMTDPQHRLFLQVCQRALEDAGYCGSHERIAVFGGVGYHLHPLGGYLRHQLDGRVFDAGFPRNHASGLQVAFGTFSEFVATQTAFRLGLTGPAMTIQTGCSAGLVAVGQAVQALWAGDADLALVATAALHIPQVFGHRHVKGSIISRSGVCRAFDAASDGTVAGNGAAAVLLKRLDDARRDGDRVYAVILGVGLSNDGASKRAYAAPSVTGQAAAIARAFDVAGVSPADVGYVEAHGTGTFKGDPIEFAAMDRVWRERGFVPAGCALGALKPSIGHLDAGAGLPGLIKAIGVLRRGVIPPLPNFTAPNPALLLDGGPFRLPAQAEPWPEGRPRLAGVTALGVGGTNAHVIVAEPPTVTPSTQEAGRRDARVPKVLPLSAADPVALRELAGRWGAYLRDHPDLAAADVVTTAALGRRHLRYRLAVLGDRVTRWAAVLQEFSSSGAAPDCLTGTVDTTDTPETDAALLDDTSDRRLAEAYCAGEPVPWRRLLADCGGRRISLPGYPFQNASHWIGPPPIPTPTTDDRDRPLGGATMTTTEQVLDHIVRTTASQVGCDTADVGADTPFPVLGADSLAMVNLANHLEKTFGVRVSMRELFEVGETPRKLAAIVTERLADRPTERPTPAPAAEPPAATPSSPAPATPSVAASAELASVPTPATPPPTAPPVPPTAPPVPPTAPPVPPTVAPVPPTEPPAPLAFTAPSPQLPPPPPPTWPTPPATAWTPTWTPGPPAGSGVPYPPAVPSGVDAHLAAAAKALEGLAIHLQQLAAAQTQLTHQLSQLLAYQQALVNPSWSGGTATGDTPGGR